MSRPKTIFCDIDGTLIKHEGSVNKIVKNNTPVLLPGVTDALELWEKQGYNIILITGRRESLRQHTETQLRAAGIQYDMLIMGIGGGDRIIINDRKLNDSKNTCAAINVDRNSGLTGIIV